MADNPKDDAAQFAALVAASGLRLREDELAKLAVMYRHFAHDRAELAGEDLGEAEPVTVFVATEPEGGVA
jgi:hypothetical protein